MSTFGLIGIAAAVALAGVGSAFGLGAAVSGAAGAWKKAFLQNKNAPGTVMILVSFPLSQTLYGFLLFNTLASVAATTNPWVILGVGVFGGLGIGASALAQGRAAAGAIDALVETGKGFSNYLIALGIVETVAIFVMAFLAFVLDYSLFAI